MKRIHCETARAVATAALSGLLLIAGVAAADTLELKNGKVLSGKYLGGTAATIRFEADGSTQVIETSQAVALTFTSSTTGASSGTASAASQATSVAPQQASSTSASATVNAGTVLLVRLIDPISSKDPQGKRFTTTLESDLTANGILVAKAGTKVYGRVQSAQQAGRYAGQSAIDLRLSELAVGPNLIPVVTSGYAQAGQGSMGKTARGAAAGAAIGAIADGGEGAGKGAAIGAVASGVRKGQAVTIQPGTLLEFKLQQPVTVPVTR